MNGNSSDMNDYDLNGAWRTAELLGKFLRKELSVQEEEELNAWKNKSEKNQLLFNELTDEKNIEKAKQWFRDSESDKAKALEALKGKIPFSTARKFSPLAKWLVAASILVIIVTGAELFIKHQRTSEASISDQAIKSADVAPGGNKATLQLSDGSVITLNDQQNGLIKKETAATISKTAEGEIIYQGNDSGSVSSSFNTITTPVGGQFMVGLPDGSKAWLNAASSLRYPVSFKNGRAVEATGEVYFEVKKEKIPFIVNTKETKIEVLGTHFNVNAYHLVQTTLLEGSVRLNDSKLLRPGEQAIANQGIQIIKLDYPEDIIAWKDGYFRFTHENIKDIMEQLARWYNINVIYEGSLSQTNFTATASRNENVSTILKNIEKAGHIHFKIEGEKVTVMP